MPSSARFRRQRTPRLQRHATENVDMFNAANPPATWASSIAAQHLREEYAGCDPSAGRAGLEDEAVRNPVEPASGWLLTLKLGLDP
jgi:hypothetical protein